MHVQKLITSECTKKCWDESHTNKSTCLILDMICVTIFASNDQRNIFYQLAWKIYSTERFKADYLFFLTMSTRCVFRAIQLPNYVFDPFELDTLLWLFWVLFHCVKRVGKFVKASAYDEFITQICAYLHKIFRLKLTTGAVKSLNFVSPWFTLMIQFFVFLANWKTSGKCFELRHLTTSKALKINSFSYSMSAKCTAKLFLLFNLPNFLL